MIHKIASAIYNDVVSGLAGVNSNPAISMDQLEDDVVDERLQIIKEYSFKGITPTKDLMIAINCVKLDCLSLDKCPCGTDFTKPELHFEIPQIINDYGEDGVSYLGAVNKSQNYKIYTDINDFKYHTYKRRGSEKPYGFIDVTPNKNNMLDGWLFNAPFTKLISVIMIPKDPRQLDEYGCCAGDNVENYTFLTAEIKKRLTEKKLRYYRSFLASPQPNNQVAR